MCAVSAYSRGIMNLVIFESVWKADRAEGSWLWLLPSPRKLEADAVAVSAMEMGVFSMMK